MFRSALKGDESLFVNPCRERPQINLILAKEKNL